MSEKIPNGAKVDLSTFTGPNGERCDKCQGGLFPPNQEGEKFGKCCIDPPRHQTFIFPPKVHGGQPGIENMTDYPLIRPHNFCITKFMAKREHLQ